MEPDEPGKETEMITRLTPPLSPEGMAEIEAELAAPPADTPERRATFARAKAARFLVEQIMKQGKHPR